MWTILDNFSTHLEELSYLSISESVFLQPHALFLGFLVSFQGISADHDKVRTIKEWPKSKTITEA